MAREQLESNLTLSDSYGVKVIVQIMNIVFEFILKAKVTRCPPENNMQMSTIDKVIENRCM